MNKKSTQLIFSGLFIGLSIFSAPAKAQTTFSKVYSIMQTKCVGCHNGSTQPNLTGSESTVYDALVNVAPSNPAATAKGDKLIAPGYPERSFLLRKCATNAWDPYSSLETAEGNVMPIGQAALSNSELEQIRQWILFGAPQTGTVVQDSTIDRFYSGLGMAEKPAPTAPAVSDGFQIRLGKFFLEPSTEIEYFKKHELMLADSLEVNRIEIFMNTQSHHYIIYKFDPSQAGSFKDGLRLPDDEPSGGSASFVTVAQYSLDLVLPQGTAYSWEKNTVLDLNYHILNYSTDSILAADVYANIYTQPKGTAQKEMFSSLILYSKYNTPTFYIPNNNQEKTFTDPVYEQGSTDQMNIWLLSSHTHKYGLDYDIYKRNPDGTKGTQLYEGYYNSDYTFNQGYYDWAHPSIRYFEPFETINISEGLIQEAKFKNNGADPVFFGLTSQDEMMLFIVQYTITENGNPTGVNKISENNETITIIPNPATSNFRINYSVKETENVSISIYNILGEEVYRESKKNQASGSYNMELNAKNLGLNPGLYFINYQSGSLKKALRLVIAD